MDYKQLFDDQIQALQEINKQLIIVDTVGNTPQVRENIRTMIQLVKEQRIAMKPE